ncbi:MAG: HEPN domain-containing protein [Deltaproteobacteria bacterium]|nr:HEPN domain-containing protein [Deltaproteobacteria bacterium]MCL5277566.1 HEPN domain-containing protein [Deltaproteobacteria bacterium]
MSYRKDLIAYRMSRAKEALQDAEILLNSKRLPSTVNRIYYALFYEVTALLLTKGLSSSKHSGIMALFNEHFVKNGTVSIETGRFYSRMFEFRQKSDYEDFVQFEEEKVKEWLVTARQFIEEIGKVIEKIIPQ